MLTGAPITVLRKKIANMKFTSDQLEAKESRTPLLEGEKIILGDDYLPCYKIQDFNLDLRVELHKS